MEEILTSIHSSSFGNLFRKNGDPTPLCHSKRPILLIMTFRSDWNPSLSDTEIGKDLRKEPYITNEDRIDFLGQSFVSRSPTLPWLTGDVDAFWSIGKLFRNTIPVSVVLHCKKRVGSIPIYCISVTLYICTYNNPR